MKTKDICKLHNLSEMTIKRAIKDNAVETETGQASKINIQGIAYRATKGKRHNAPWIIELDKGEPVTMASLKKENEDAESFLMKKEKMKFEKLKLEVDKLSEGLESTREKIRQEIIADAKVYCEQALLQIHSVYMKFMKVDTVTKKTLEKELDKALKNIKEIS